MLKVKLSRKEKVEKLLKQLTEEHYRLYDCFKIGFDAETIGHKLEINRSNASKELNDLLKEDKVIKIKGKPVLYLHKSTAESLLGYELGDSIVNCIADLSEKTSDYIIKSSSKNENVEEAFNLIGNKESLKLAIEQAKAAIIYPPKGLSTLIIGPTGVGKSIFAEYMYKYGQYTKTLHDDSPFIIFNCADYSDNQQLLLAQLFGHVKGAFTGADYDKDGLVKKADNGILFLDEVHRLSAEGQEMLFLLMDKGIYRRLGEVNKTHHCKVMIIAATTENPQTSMLETFLRRIPVTIQLPALAKRSLSERMELICQFFKDEARRVGICFSVAKEVIKSFMLYECKGNIGQLKSDIQLICARAFLDYMSFKRERVEVKLSLLPNNIREGLYTNHKREEMIKTFNLIGNDSIVFDIDNQADDAGLLLVDKKYNMDFYEIIKDKWERLEKEGKSEIEIREDIDQDIQHYSFSLMNTMIYNNSDKTAYDKLLDNSIYSIVKNVLIHYERWKEDERSNKLIKAITLHIQTLIDRLKVGNILMHPGKEEILKERAFECAISKEILKQVSVLYGIEFPLDEELFLATFLYMTLSINKQENVGIMIIMHGASTASSMADVANELLGVHHAHAINMKLDAKVQDILIEAIRLAPSIHRGKGILLLTDMGSILTFAKVIEDATGVKCKAIDMVSTPIVLDATRKALNPDISLEDLYISVLESVGNYRNFAGNREVREVEGIRYFDKLLIDNISKTLTFLDAEKAYFVLRKAMESFSEETGIEIEDDMVVKFVFHCCCMIERIIMKDVLSYKRYEERIQGSYPLYVLLKRVFKVVEETFAIQITNMEYASILDIFEMQYGRDFLQDLLS